MSIPLSLSPRDYSLLRLLSWTPATTSQLWRASVTFEGEPFIDERRLRERLQALCEARVVRSWPMAQAAGGLMNYYKLASLGFTLLCGTEAPQPPRAFFAEVSPSLAVHTFRLADAIVTVLCACAAGRVTIERFMRENELLLHAGDRQVQPDCFFRLTSGGRAFNLALEIDNSMASIETYAFNGIREKLLTYQAYQDTILAQWYAGGKQWEQPRLRVVFLTQSVERAYHILGCAGEIATSKARRLVYAATLDSFVTAGEPLHAPLFLDHFGRWKALIDLHPSAPFARASVRLKRPIACPLAVC